MRKEQRGCVCLDPASPTEASTVILLYEKMSSYSNVKAMTTRTSLFRGVAYEGWGPSSAASQYRAKSTTTCRQILHTVNKCRSCTPK